MIDRNGIYYILISFCFSVVIYFILIIMKDKQIGFYLPYVITALINYLMFLITFLLTKRVMNNKENNAFFLFFI